MQHRRHHSPQQSLVLDSVSVEPTSSSKLSILEIRISPLLWFKWLLLSVLVLTAASIFSQIFSPILGIKLLKRWLYVDAEGNLPTLFSTLTLFLCAVLLAVIAGVKRLRNDRYTWHWGWLSIIFVYLAIDEAIRIHEATIRPIRNLLNTSGLLYYAWVIPAAALVITCFWLYLRFLRDLPRQIRFLVLLSGGMYVFGALVLELFAGQYAEINGRTGMFHVFATVEEIFEMLGVVIFIYGLLTHLASYLQPEVRIKFY